MGRTSTEIDATRCENSHIHSTNKTSRDLLPMSSSCLAEPDSDPHAIQIGWRSDAYSPQGRAITCVIIERQAWNTTACNLSRRAQPVRAKDHLCLHHSRSSGQELRTLRDVLDSHRVTGEAVSHRGGAKARGVHRALQGV